ncbi:MAG: hypothetical protein CBC09_08595 [Cellvibrionales bacterium TMED49]|nr:hypothetical protein [Porticoccaceae bacterium]OUU35963.1 MAG: hypothetical protein CBC09_08595 [Cellvibrionales bacterium TMED49]|tara:strand:- start:830 stop:1060 length:231 start_codon:yes stop_codon:yes gene_type:complete
MINKNDLAREIYEKSDKKIALKDVNKIVTDLFNEMTNKLQEGNEIQINDFGTFSLSENIKQEIVKVSKTKATKGIN